MTYRQGQIWNYVTYDGRVRIPFMLKGPRGMYDSGGVADWRHDLVCDCGHRWSVTENSLRGKTVRKAYPICCGRPECPYTPVAVKKERRTEPKIVVTLSMPWSLYKIFEDMVESGEYTSRSTAIMSALVEWRLSKGGELGKRSERTTEEIESVPIEDVECELGI